MPKALPFKYAYGPYSKGANSWYILFGRKGSKTRKHYGLAASNEAGAIAEAYELGRRFEAGLFDPWKHKAEKLTLAEARKLYIQHNRDLSPATIRERRILLERFCRWIPAETQVGDLNPKYFQSFLASASLTASTKQGYHSKLRAFMRWLLKQGYIQTSPMEDISAPKSERKLPEYLTKDQFNHLVTSIEDDIMRRRKQLVGRLDWLVPAIRLTVATGLRLQELCNLRWRDVDLVTGRLYVRSYRTKDGKKVRTKSRHDRSVPIFPMARLVLEELAQKRPDSNDNSTVFFSVGLQPLYANRVSRTLRDYREERKLGKYTRPACLPEDLSWHSLRHTFASWLVTDGVPLKYVQEWLGHADIGTTQIYAHLIADHAHDIGTSTFAA
jgi:site-specific recombinase XerD